MENKAHARSSLVMGLGLIALLLFTANFYQYVTQRLLPRLTQYAVFTPPRCDRSLRIHTFVREGEATRDKHGVQIQIHRSDRQLAEIIARQSTIHLRPFSKFMRIEAEMRRLKSDLQAEELELRRLERRLRTKSAEMDAAAGRAAGQSPHVLIER
ncbi:hypothetical protein [Rhodocaloribacter sp.]